MVTYDDFIQTCYDLADDSTVQTLGFISRMGNIGYRRAMKLFGRQFEERTKTSSTTAAQQYYQLPIDYSILKTITVTVGTQKLPLEEIKGQARWDDLNRMTNMTNGRPTHYFVRLNSGIAGDEVGIFPTPSTSGNVVTLVYEAIPKAIGVPAYTTGTINVANQGISVTGIGSAFTSQMIDRYFQVSIPYGDGNYYRITGVNSPTSINLQNYYEGPIATNVAYSIFELFALPEEAQMIPVYFTMWQYYLMRQNPESVKLYKGLHDDDLAQAKINQSEKTREGVVRRGNIVTFSTNYPPYFPSTITSSP